jgi:hypothetical protein
MNDPKQLESGAFPLVDGHPRAALHGQLGCVEKGSGWVYIRREGVYIRGGVYMEGIINI